MIIPTYQEADAIDACLEAVERQTFAVDQVFVVDGGSTDGTRALAAGHRGVTVIENPRRMQSAALNLGLNAAAADVIVRVDGHCTIADDYVERCVAALDETGAAVVGGAMTPVVAGQVQEGIAAAMASRFGAGPARFHVGGRAGWVDTVYLGAYRREDALAVGGYAEDVGVNEDAEFAHRMGRLGGVWFDPSIRSEYTPRDSLRAVGRQFYRYGRSRARTALRHPGSVKPRQLVAPAVVVGLMSPWRRSVAGVYAASLLGAAAVDGRQLGPLGAGVYAATLPVMHLTWGAGFLIGLLRPFPAPVIDS